MPGPANARRALFFVACVLCGAPAADAQQFVSTGRGTLRGLTGVEVVVDRLPPEIVGLGLSSHTIQTDIERQLRDRHVIVFASQRANPSPAQAYLYVHANALSFDRDNRNAIAIQVQLRQTLQSLVTGSRIVDAMTWDAHNVLVVPPSGVGDLRAEIRAYVEQFIEDWTAVH